MGNIIGKSIDSFVGDQIRIRQEIQGKGTNGNPRTLEDISYLNTRTAWIKLASGVSIEKERYDLMKTSDNNLFTNLREGSSLAENNILFNGLSSIESNSRVGIPTNFSDPKDSAYGIGGKDFGFTPMPGIVDASIKSLNRGSLRKAIINIKAHNKYQLDMIDVLYMRLGYTVLLEWGYNKYFKNDGKGEELTNMGPTLIEKEFFSNTTDNSDYSSFLQLLEKERDKHSGNYEAMFGHISNFSWTFEKDGSYSIKVEIMSLGDVLESLKINTPTQKLISVKDVKDSKEAKIRRESKPKGIQQFIIKDSINKDGIGLINESTANAAGYYMGAYSYQFTKFGEDDEGGFKQIITVGSVAGPIYDMLRVYEDKDGNYWYYVYGDIRLYKEFVRDDYDAEDAFEKAKEELKNKNKEEKESEAAAMEVEVTKLKESKLSYLLFAIKEANSKKRGKNKPISTFIFRNNKEKRRKDIGEAIDSSKLKKIFQVKTEADVIATDIYTGKSGVKNYYMRFGTLLEYIQDRIFPVITPSNKPLLVIDTDIESNIMYTISNQLSTDPEVCLIRNDTFEDKRGMKIFFKGLEEYIGNIGGIKYGKIMNIYINFNFIQGIIESGGVVSNVSVYKFLSNICTGINESLGGVNNIEPIIKESSNSITIIEQTKIPGKEILIEKLEKEQPKRPPELELFGYNKIPKSDDQTSNFVRGVGLQTSITKEYATMITIGATAQGYIPGEEATAFSRWNIGIEDRFKKGLKDSDSLKKTVEEASEKEKLLSMAEDNKGIVEKYQTDYASKNRYIIIGCSEEDIGGTKGSQMVTNSELIKVNTSAVNNYNKYLQASASLSDKSSQGVESSVGFLPFNLSLTMDGISGFKIYNKLDVNTKFLPSNYPEAIEFIITGVDHKILNNDWETSLSTLGTSKGTNKGSSIGISTNLLEDTEPSEAAWELSSQKNIDSLHKDFQPIVTKVMNELTKEGWEPGLGGGFRNRKKQYIKKQEGKSKVDYGYHNVVVGTIEKPERSSLAVDLIDTRYRWGQKTDRKFDYTSEKSKKALEKIAKKEGLGWGGDWFSEVSPWKNTKHAGFDIGWDPAHIQLESLSAIKNANKKFYGEYA